MAKKKQKRPRRPAQRPPVHRSVPPTSEPVSARKAAPSGVTRGQEQRAAAAQAARRAELRRKVTAGVLVTAAVVIIGAFVLYDRQRDAELDAALTGGSCSTDSKTDPGDSHQPSPTFAVNPPAAGDHLSSAARAGAYRDAQVPPDGQLVHSLEHGYVVYWHSPDLPEDQQAELDRLERAFAGDVIVAERPGLQDPPVAATAWGRRLLCQEVEPAALTRFAEEYIGKGPENVPRG